MREIVKRETIETSDGRPGHARLRERAVNRAGRWAAVRRGAQDAGKGGAALGRTLYRPAGYAAAHG